MGGCWRLGRIYSCFSLQIYTDRQWLWMTATMKVRAFPPKRSLDGAPSVVRIGNGERLG